MFCPKCATQNLDGASFCRSCGANISLVPQAMTGQFARQSDETSVAKETHGRRPGKELTLDQAFKNLFMGIAFLIISVVLSRLPFGFGWWFWMLLPAFSLMGTGIAQYIRIRQREQQQLEAGSNPRAFANLPTAQPLSAPNTDQFMPPAPSVTEGTTRHLTHNKPDNQ